MSTKFYQKPDKNKNIKTLQETIFKCFIGVKTFFCKLNKIFEKTFY